MDRLNFLLIATFAFLMDKQYKRVNLKRGLNGRLAVAKNQK